MTRFNVNNIWAANGSNEIIQSIFLAFGAGSALGFTPSYSMHPLIAKVAGTSWVAGTRNSDFSFNLAMAIDDIRTQTNADIYYHSNNPTGMPSPSVILRR